MRVGSDETGRVYNIAKINSYDSYIYAGYRLDESFSAYILKLYNFQSAVAFIGVNNDLPAKKHKKLEYFNKNVSNIRNAYNVNLDFYTMKYKNILLKMDIQGAESVWLNSLNEKKINAFKQIVITIYPNVSINALKKLNNTHFIINIDNNNKQNSKIVTYVRKDLVDSDVEYRELDDDDNGNGNDNDNDNYVHDSDNDSDNNGYGNGNCDGDEYSDDNNISAKPKPKLNVNNSINNNNNGINNIGSSSSSNKVVTLTHQKLSTYSHSQSHYPQYTEHKSAAFNNDEYFKVITIGDGNANAVKLNLININVGSSKENIIQIANILPATTSTYDGYIYANMGATYEDVFSNYMLEMYNFQSAAAFIGSEGVIPFKKNKKMEYFKKNVSNLRDSENVNLDFYTGKFKNIFLKMDIKGNENVWLTSLNKKKIKTFKQIVITIYPNISTSVLKKLNNTHCIIYIREKGNSKTITYLRKDVFNERFVAPEDLLNKLKDTHFICNIEEKNNIVTIRYHKTNNKIYPQPPLFPPPIANTDTSVVVVTNSSLDSSTSNSLHP
jgi:hypothetical protein